MHSHKIRNLQHSVFLTPMHNTFNFQKPIKMHILDLFQFLMTFEYFLKINVLYNTYIFIQKTKATEGKTMDEESEKKIADLTAEVKVQEEEAMSTKAEVERLQTIVKEMEEDKAKKEKDIEEMQE